MRRDRLDLAVSGFEAGSDATLGDRTAAVVVVFRPETDPRPLLAQLRGFVALTIVADNSKLGHPALVDLPSRLDCSHLHTRNQGGLAGAYNQAIALIGKQAPHITHIVFLDEDSDASGLGRLLADREVCHALNQIDTAAVAPAYVDRATGLRGRYIDLQRWRIRHLPRVFDGLRQVAFVINSMSIWRLDALRRIGRFNEGLAIDHVDTEACLRARRAGLGVFVHGSHEFLHSIGQRRRFTLLGHEMQAGGHAPARRYLIGRNTAWLGRNHLVREPAFAALCVARLAYEAFGIVKVESDRIVKLWALLRCIMVGLLTIRMR